MPSGTPTHPPLRGYVPYGELDVSLERQRSALMLEVPMWEGSDRAYLRSIRYPGPGAQWIRPSHIAAGPSWVWDRNAGRAGFPKSGHNAINVYGRNGKVAGGQGYRYEEVWDQTLSAFVVGPRFSVLIVGTPMAFTNPNLAPVNRGDSWRAIWFFRPNAGFVRHAFEMNYLTEQMRTRFNNSIVTATPALPFYGLRCSFLYTQGATGSGQGARLYIGYEDGQIRKATFPGLLIGGMQDARHLELFESELAINEGATGGGCWEYFAHYARTFDDEEAVAISRDALASVKWDPYVVRRIGFEQGLGQVAATPGAFPRVSASPASRPRLIAVPSSYQRVSASPRHTGPRVAAEPTTYQRVSARIRIADEEVFDVQATALCPSELNWEADNILELADVLDELTDPATPITSATSVECQIFDRATGLAITVSPVALSQVGTTNTWRGSVLTNATNGFAHHQRLTLVFIFNGGAGLTGRFVALAVVASATS